MKGKEQEILALTRLLFENLVAKKVVSYTDDISGQKTYNLINSKNNSDVVLSDIVSLTQKISDFRDLVMNAYRLLSDKTPSDIDLIPASDMISFFREKGILFFPIFNSRLKDLFDNTKQILNDEEFRKEAIELTDIQNKFPSFIAALLEFYVSEIFKKEYQGVVVRREYQMSATTIDLVLEEINLSKVDILCEVMFRMRSMNTLRDDLLSSIDKLEKYERLNGKDACLIMAVFIDEESDVVDRLRYRFNQFMEESFSDKVSKVFLVALYYKNISTFAHSLQKVKIQIDALNSTLIEFVLASKSAQGENDDDVYNEVFDLNNGNFQITLKPETPAQHWRFGLKFSESPKLLETERHQKGTQLIHLEKNASSPVLGISQYDETQTQLLYSIPTEIANYEFQVITFQVENLENKIRVNIVDENRKLLTEPIVLKRLRYFVVMAWADGINKFSFKVNLFQRYVAVKQSSRTLRLEVRNSEDDPISNCQVVAISENGTYLESVTSERGECEITLPLKNKYTIILAKKGYRATIFKDNSIDFILINMEEQKKGGSLVIPSGTGAIEGLNGSLNPIFDTSSRTYLYAQNISINNEAQQPVTFEIDEHLHLEDSDGNTMTIIIRFIKGRTALIDYIKE